MTLIALTLNRGNPIMMADLLISAVDASGQIEIPTYLKGTGQLLNDLKGRRPADLKQKLYVINDRLCLALGGRGDQMLTFLNRIKALFGSIDFQYASLEDYVKNYPPEDRTNLTSIIL